MVQSLQLGNSNQSAEDKGMKRLNRLPLYFGIGLAVLFLAVLVYGLSSRGLHFGSQNPDEAGSNVPASNFAEQMKRGVTDGIIGDREDQPVYQPTPVTPTKIETKPVELQKQEQVRDERPPRMELRKNGWRDCGGNRRNNWFASSNASGWPACRRAPPRWIRR